MTSVRPLEERDIPGVTRLFGRVNPQARWASPAECESYFHQIFLRNPWVDPLLPSWVADENGCIVGFVGVMPRPMRHKERPIRTAVVSQLMVDRQKRHAPTAAKLLRKVLAGAQDLTISEGANESYRGMWEAAGGLTLALYNLQWRRLLRPVRCALQLASGRPARAAALLAAPLAALADAYAAHRTSLRRTPRLLEEPLDTASLLAALKACASSVALAPHYDFASLDWQLAQAHAKRPHGKLQARLLRQPDGQIAGWFLYYLNRSTSQVLQLGAQAGSESAVFEQLFHHAWLRDATAIEGRMEPRLARTLGERHCFFNSSSVYTLVHARDPAALASLAHGDAHFSRLEGEWWMRFADGPRSAEAPGSAAAELISRLRFSSMRPNAA
jgi:hypothetical protein